MASNLVLVVDDEIDVLEGLTKCLTRAGYEVLTAATGKEAFQRIQEQHPTIIILDVLLPDTNGFEICQKLKEDDATKDIPIILSTARFMEHNEPWLVGTHADDYLAKPYRPEKLLEKINKLIK